MAQKDILSLLGKNKQVVAPQSVAQPAPAQTQSPKDALKQSLGKKPVFNFANKPKKNCAPAPAASATSPITGNGAQGAAVQPPLSAPTVSTAAPPVAAKIDADEYTHSSQPEKFTQEEVQSLRNAIELLKDSFEHKQQISDAIRRVMICIEKNPHLADILEPEDYGKMIRGMRLSYGVVIAKKDARAEKKSKREESISAIENQLSELSFDL